MNISSFSIKQIVVVAALVAALLLLITTFTFGSVPFLGALNAEPGGEGDVQAWLGPWGFWLRDWGGLMRGSSRIVYA